MKRLFSGYQTENQYVLNFLFTARPVLWSGRKSQNNYLVMFKKKLLFPYGNFSWSIQGYIFKDKWFLIIRCVFFSFYGYFVFRLYEGDIWVTNPHLHPNYWAISTVSVCNLPQKARRINNLIKRWNWWVSLT